jgi:hypothetical protein
MEPPDRLADRYQCHRDRKLECIKDAQGPECGCLAIIILLMLGWIQSIACFEYDRIRAPDVRLYVHGVDMKAPSFEGLPLMPCR